MGKWYVGTVGSFIKFGHPKQLPAGAKFGKIGD